MLMPFHDVDHCELFYLISVETKKSNIENVHVTFDNSHGDRHLDGLIGECAASLM